MKNLRTFLLGLALLPACGCIMVVGHTPDGASKVLRYKTSWGNDESGCGCEACGCEDCHAPGVTLSPAGVPPTPVPVIPPGNAGVQLPPQ